MSLRLPPASAADPRPGESSRGPLRPVPHHAPCHCEARSAEAIFCGRAYESPAPPRPPRESKSNRNARASPGCPKRASARHVQSPNRTTVWLRRPTPLRDCPRAGLSMTACPPGWGSTRDGRFRPKLAVCQPYRGYSYRTFNATPRKRFCARLNRLRHGAPAPAAGPGSSLCRTAGRSTSRPGGRSARRRGARDGAEDQP
jgi:hypothetical protein